MFQQSCKAERVLLLFLQEIPSKYSRKLYDTAIRVCVRVHCLSFAFLGKDTGLLLSVLQRAGTFIQGVLCSSLLLISCTDFSFIFLSRLSMMLQLDLYFTRTMKSPKLFYYCFPYCPIASTWLVLKFTFLCSQISPCIQNRCYRKHSGRIIYRIRVNSMATNSIQISFVLTIRWLYHLPRSGLRFYIYGFALALSS